MFLFLFSQVRILAPHNTCVFVCFFLQPHNAQNCFRSAASAPLTNNTLPVACSKFPTALFVLIIYVSLYSQNIFTSQLLCRLVLFFLINLIKVDKNFLKEPDNLVLKCMWNHRESRIALTLLLCLCQLMYSVMYSFPRYEDSL